MMVFSTTCTSNFLPQIRCITTIATLMSSLTAKRPHLLIVVAVLMLVATHCGSLAMGAYTTTDPRTLAPPTSGFVIRPNTATTFAVAARNLIPEEATSSGASTTINDEDASYLQDAREHIWSTPLSDYQPFSTRTGLLVSTDDSTSTISTDGLDGGYLTAVGTWEGIWGQSFSSITDALVDMDDVKRSTTSATNTGQAIIEFSLDSTDIRTGVFTDFNQSRLVWDEAAIRSDIFSAFVSKGWEGETTVAGAYSATSLLPESDLSSSDAASSRDSVVIHLEDIFPNTPSFQSDLSYLNDTNFIGIRDDGDGEVEEGFFNRHFQIYNQDAVVALSEATARVPATPTRLRQAVDSYASTIVPLQNQTRRGTVLRILLGLNTNFGLRRLDASVVFVIPLSRWTVVEEVVWVPPAGVIETDTLRPSKLLFAPEDMSMKLRFITEAPSAVRQRAVFIVCCAMGVGSIATGGGGWMGLTSLQTLLLSTTTTGCTEPFTDFLFRGTYGILVAPASYISNDSEINFVATAVFIILALVLHAVVAKIRGLCAKGADQSFWRAASWCYFPVVFLLATTYLWTYLIQQTFLNLTDGDSSGLVKMSFLICWLIIAFVTMYVWFEALKEGREGYFLVTDLTRFSARYRGRLQQHQKRVEKRNAERCEDERKKEERREMLGRMQGGYNGSNPSSLLFTSSSSVEHDRQKNIKLKKAQRQGDGVVGFWERHIYQLLGRFAFIIIPVGSWPSTRGYGACRGLFRDTSCSFAIITLFFVAIIASVSASDDCQALFLNSSLVQLVYLVVFALIRPFRIWFLNMMWLLIKMGEIALNGMMYSVVVSQKYRTSTAQAMPAISVVLLGLNATFVFYAVAVTFVERSIRNRSKLREYRRAVGELRRIQHLQERYPNRDLEIEKDAHATLLLVAAAPPQTTPPPHHDQLRSMRMNQKDRDTLKYRHFYSALKEVCDTEEGDYMEWGYTSRGAIAASLGTSKESYITKGGVGAGVGSGSNIALSGATQRGLVSSPWEVDADDPLLLSLVGDEATISSYSTPTTAPNNSIPQSRRMVFNILDGFVAEDEEFVHFKRDYLLSLCEGGGNPFR